MKRGEWRKEGRVKRVEGLKREAGQKQTPNVERRTPNEGEKGKEPRKRRGLTRSTPKRFASRRAIQPFAATIGFLKLTRRVLPRRAKSLLSSFFFCARTNLFLGRLRAPPDGFNNPPDTRNRPGERFPGGPSSPRRVCDRTGIKAHPFRRKKSVLSEVVTTRRR